MKMTRWPTSGDLARSTNTKRPWSVGGRACVAFIVATLAACGGGGADPSSVDGSSTIGTAGGTVADASGAQVIVPTGALDDATTIRIAKDSAGAPALPEGASLASPVYALTPHGIDFHSPTRLRIPFDASRFGAGARPVLLKAQPGGEWIVQTAVERDGASLLVDAHTFSFYAVTWCELAQTNPYCASSNYTVTIDLVDPAVTKPGARGAKPASATATVTRPRYVDLELNYTAPPVAYGLTFKVFGSGGRPQLPKEMISGPLPPSPARVRVPVTEADNGVLSLWVEISCVTRPDSLSRTGQPVCDPNADQSGSPPFLATLPFKAASNYTVIQVSIPPGTPAGDLAPLISVQPHDITVAEGEGVPEFSVEVVTPSTRHFWEASVDGGVTWIDLGSFPVKMVDPAGGPFCFLYDPPCERTRVLADPSPRSASLPYCALSDNACDEFGGVTARMSGRKMRARLVNDFGTVVSNVATLTVVRPVPPSILQQPQSVQVVQGQTASFHTLAGGLPVPQVCWQSAPAGSETWTDVVCDGRPTLTTAALTPNDSGRRYRVRASNGGGVVDSDVATLSVIAAPQPPIVVTQPQAITVRAGGVALFATAVSGTAPLSYQWLRNGTAIAGANAPVLRLDAVAAGDDGASFALEVTNTVGAVRSSPAALTVLAAGSSPPPSPPGIVTQPASVQVGAGNTATFAVGPDGSGPFTFQWRKGGVPIAGATSAALTLRNVAPADAGTYSVDVGNAAGTTTSSGAVLDIVATPAVTVAPIITTQPATLVVAPGSAATLAVASSGTGPLMHQWARNGVPIPGADSAVFQVASVSALDAGSYAVTISNAAGSVSSAAAQLILLGAPQITASPSARTLAVGDVATFSVSASGDNLRYQWMRNGTAIAGATAATLTTPALSLADNGAVYAVSVYNGSGLIFSQPAVITVITSDVAASITQQPLGQSVVAGAAATFSIGTSGSPTPAVTWQTSPDGSNWSGAGSGDTLNLASTTLAQDGLRVRALVTNSTAGVGGPQTNTLISNIVTLSVAPSLPANALTGVQVVAHADRSLVLRSDGSVVAFGVNTDPATGGYLNTTVPIRPVVVAGLPAIRQVAIGTTYSSWALGAEGSVWGWGFINSVKGFGLGPANSQVSFAAPVRVLMASGTPIDRVCQVAGTAYGAVMVRSDVPGGTCAASEPRSVWFTGDSISGSEAGGFYATRLDLLGGDGSAGGLPQGRWIVDLTSSRDFSSTTSTVFARANDGTVYAWGWNAQGQLGTGDTTSRTVPTIVAGWQGATRIAATAEATLALMSDGSVKGTGSNVGATLGIGSTATTVTTPSPLTAPTGAGDLAAASGQPGAMALVAGQLRFWGSNNRFSSAAQLTPVALAAPAAFTSLSVAGLHALAIGPGGAVYAWGNWQARGCGNFDNTSCNDTLLPTMVLTP